jgi:DNA-directed RNA polymerase specialized sigma24 family protein
MTTFVQTPSLEIWPGDRLSNDSVKLVEDALPRARKLDVAAIETILRVHYPRVCRIAMAICGREKQGKQSIRTVMRQSIKPIRFWNSEGEAANWFLHHTILVSREHVGGTPNAREDCLVQTLSTPSPEHTAFVRALRLLPHQQREAFLLFRGEHLDPRRVGVAMDCSTGAADTHRLAAEKAMTEVAGETFEERSAELVRVYATLTPPEELIVGDVAAICGRVRNTKLARAIRLIFQLIILGAIIWFVWQISRMIVI